MPAAWRRGGGKGVCDGQQNAQGIVEQRDELYV
jgi:hypothetical protein